MTGERRQTSALFGALLTIAVGSASPLHAQPSQSDRALATELFRQGRALMAEGKHAEACPKLEESQRLDPGGGTLLNLALCHEKVGKTATAWAELAEAAAVAQRDGRKDREKLAAEQAAALEPQLMRLTIQVPAAADLPDLVITRNGAVLARTAWGTAMPLDAGDYTIAASAPGRRGSVTLVRVATAGATVTVTVPTLETVPLEASKVCPEQPVKEVVVYKRADPLPPPEDRSTPFLIAGVSTAGLGVVGLVLGGVFGGIATQRQSTLDEVCSSGETKACPTDRQSDIDEMKTLAKASTGSFVVGAIAVAAGASLIGVGLSRRDDGAPRVGVTFGPTGLALEGDF